MPNEIKTAERIMESDPDSALHILQHMHTDKLMYSAADRALYGILLFQALEKNGKTLQPECTDMLNVMMTQHYYI